MNTQSAPQLAPPLDVDTAQRQTDAMVRAFGLSRALSLLANYAHVQATKTALRHIQDAAELERAAAWQRASVRIMMCACSPELRDL
jgi:hypothetical protein